MLRFDPGPGRIHTARQFSVWEGGGEYNVARGLRRCFGLRAGAITALADNPVGRLVEDAMGWMATKYTTDGLHPDYQGKRMIGEAIGKYLSAHFPWITKDLDKKPIVLPETANQ